MTRKVSGSHTGHNRPKPSRQERDEAYSSGAGRKAEEEELRKPAHSGSDNASDSKTSAPIGTELETKAAERFH